MKFIFGVNVRVNGALDVVLSVAPNLLATKRDFLFLRVATSNSSQIYMSKRIIISSYFIFAFIASPELK